MVHPLASLAQQYTLKGSLITDTVVSAVNAQGNWQVGNPNLDLRIQIIERVSTNPTVRANYGIDLHQTIVRCFIISVSQNGVIFPPNGYQLDQLNKELWTLDDRIKYTIVDTAQALLKPIQQVFGKQFLAIKETI